MTKIRTMTMESIWNDMEWYGTVHMESMDYSMDSIWNRTLSENSPSPTWIPYSFHGSFHLDSMDWIPWIPPGIHME